MNANDQTITIELLALDLESCGRCTGTDANLEAAIADVADVLREAAVRVDLRKTVVRSAAQAERLKFESSPTIRVNGRDIALELRETNCGDCGDLCNCEGGVDCRVWVWRGKEYTEAPKGLIIEAILRSLGGSASPETSEAFRLPQNLRSYFDGISPDTKPVAEHECCDRDTCCEESERAVCCGPVHSGEACGCGG